MKNRQRSQLPHTDAPQEWRPTKPEHTQPPRSALPRLDKNADDSLSLPRQRVAMNSCGPWLPLLNACSKCETDVFARYSKQYASIPSACIAAALITLCIQPRK